MSSDKLLQTLSDVLCWILGNQKVEDFIDIRSEAPDETTARILSALRILRYTPPNNIEEMYVILFVQNVLTQTIKYFFICWIKFQKTWKFTGFKILTCLILIYGMTT